MRKLWMGLGSVVMFACSGKAIDVGPSPESMQPDAATGTGGTTGMVSPRPPSWPDPDACVAASNAPITGTWKGYVESVGAPWDNMLLVIRGVSEGGAVCGTLTVGSGAPLPPATDPSVGYPPGVEITQPFNPAVLAGFTYTLLDATLVDERLRFGIGRNEPWRGWCSLQTPVADEREHSFYRCVAGWPFMVDASSCSLTDPTTGPPTSIDCEKIWLCMSETCWCDANRCAAADGAREAFDVHISGGEADGSSPLGRARFFRSE